jgi:hypothetical protein
MQPWYPGQMGVNGSDVQKGLRWGPSAIVMFVDENAADPSDAHDGTDPEHPMATIQGAVTKLIAHQTALAHSLAGSVIVVGAGATIAESVVVPATAPEGVTIMAETNGAYIPTWSPGASAGTCLTLRAQDWRVTGFEFNFTGNSTAIRLEWVPGSSYNASGTVIDHNHFSGWWAGLYGINLVGAPYNVNISNNEFNEIRSAGGAGTAYAIATTDASEANAYQCGIYNNLFTENENHIGSFNNDRSFNCSFFQGNVFYEGELVPSTLQLDLRGGSRGNNVVTGNTFCGDYSNAGGYYANAGSPGMWGGNIAEDVLEAEVSDSGLTIAPPAA